MPRRDIIFLTTKNAHVLQLTLSAIEKHRVVQLSSTSKMNLITFKTDRNVTQNNQY